MIHFLISLEMSIQIVFYYFDFVLRNLGTQVLDASGTYLALNQGSTEVRSLLSDRSVALTIILCDQAEL